MKERTHYLWLVLAGVLLLLNLPIPASRQVKAFIREAFSPFQQVAGGWTGHVRSATRALRSKRVLNDSADAMARELFVLRDEVRQLREIERENTALRDVLGFAAQSDKALVPCQILSRGDISGWWHTIRIDGGIAGGVTNDMAVLSFDGLVGRVLAVTDSTAEVLLVTDRNCKVAVRVSGTDVLGIMRGDASSINGAGPLEMFRSAGRCRMDFVDRGVDLAAGDMIETSGLGGVYPPGALVGVVTAVQEDPSGLYQVADVMPVLDVRGLRYVFVVRR